MTSNNAAQAISSLSALNKANSSQAMEWFLQTCSAQAWCLKMLKQRPFHSVNTLVIEAKEQWKTMSPKDLLEAFSGHPMIGDISTLREKYAHTKAIASNEQSGTQDADEATLKSLHELNHEYVKRHGFIFIICATGLSAESMLQALQERLSNSTQLEIENAAQEQIKITELRIKKALSSH